MNKITTVFSFCMLALGGAVLTSCNDDWKEEQYAHYISFKAPLATSGTSVGVTTVYVPWTRLDDELKPLYGAEGLSHYELPVLVAGSTTNPSDLNVKIAHSDTLDVLNVERFGHRAEIYYKDMSDFAEVPGSVKIPAGKDVALLKIKLDFNKNGGIDLIDRYVLPLKVVPGQGYERNPRKNYATAMLRILPYNDFTGICQATNLLYNLCDDRGNPEGVSTGMNTVQTYACGENKVFFYAGTIDERSLLRKYFRIYAEFTPQPGFTPSDEIAARGTVSLYVDSSENPELNFRQVGEAQYMILTSDDPVQTYIQRRTLVVSDINYYYTDSKSSLGSNINYVIKGTMTMERKLNTQMPVEDQIVWD